MSRLSSVIRELAGRIHEIESAETRHARADASLKIPALHAVLPEAGLPCGSLVELLAAADGAGAWTLALLVARQAIGARKTVVIVDGSKSFYPPAAARLGVDLERAIVVRPTMQREVYLAANLSLRCPAVGALVACCDRLSGLEFRRLQLSAEAEGGVGILLRRLSALRSPSFAALRLLVSPVPSAGRCPRLRVEALRCRGGKPGQSLLLEIDDETNDVRLPAELAAPAAGTRAARAAR